MLVAPAVVVVVVQGEQVFDSHVSRVDAMGGTEVALNLVKAGGPVAVHVPARSGDPGDDCGGFASDADDIEVLEELEDQAREMADMVEAGWLAEGL